MRVSVLCTLGGGERGQAGQWQQCSEPGQSRQCSEPMLCLQLCDEVRKDVPTDPHVLHTLRLIYAREGRHGEVTAMYQAAAVAAPGDPALLEGLFAALVR